MYCPRIFFFLILEILLDKNLGLYRKRDERKMNDDHRNSGENVFLVDRKKKWNAKVDSRQWQNKSWWIEKEINKKKKQSKQMESIGHFIYGMLLLLLLCCLIFFFVFVFVFMVTIIKFIQSFIFIFFSCFLWILNVFYSYIKCFQRQQNHKDLLVYRYIYVI